MLGASEMLGRPAGGNGHREEKKIVSAANRALTDARIERIRTIPWSMQSDDKERENGLLTCTTDGGNGVMDAPHAKLFLCRNSCAAMLRQHGLLEWA